MILKIMIIVNLFVLLKKELFINEIKKNSFSKRNKNINNENKYVLSFTHFCKKKKEIKYFIITFFYLMLINFLFTNYLFNGYQYLINHMRVKDKIIINDFVYVKQNDCFCVDDGFAINYNGITYCRLSNILTLYNYWQFIIQFGFDIFITIQYLFFGLTNKYFF